MTQGLLVWVEDGVLKWESVIRPTQTEVEEVYRRKESYQKILIQGSVNKLFDPATISMPTAYQLFGGKCKP